MTQIVYDGKHLIADRKVYAGYRLMGKSIKLKSVVHNGKILHYAFAGSSADCDIGEKVVASNFSPDMCKWAVDRLGHDNLQDMFYGIVVEVDADSSLFDQHRVYLVNYAGDKCEMAQGEFLAVGAMDLVIMDVQRTIQAFSDKEVSTAEIIRFALQGSHQTQDGYVLDQVDLRTGVYENV